MSNKQTSSVKTASAVPFGKVITNETAKATDLKDVIEVPNFKLHDRFFDAVKSLGTNASENQLNCSVTDVFDFKESPIWGIVLHRYRI